MWILLLGFSVWAESPVAELAFPRHQVMAHLFWQVEPAESREAVLRVRLTSPLNATLNVDLIMPEMDHRPLMGHVRQLSPQEFEVKRLLFFMRGAWDVRVSLKSFWIGSEQKVWPVEIGPGGICSPR